MKARLLITSITAIIIAMVLSGLLFIPIDAGRGNAPSVSKEKADTVLVSKSEEEEAPEKTLPESCTIQRPVKKRTKISWSSAGLSIGLPLQWKI